MLYVGERNNSLPMNTLIAQMQQSLHDQPVGEPFIVSALLPQQWPSLTRAEKLSLAKQLAYLVDQNPGTYKRIGKKYKTWIYEKC